MAGKNTGERTRLAISESFRKLLRKKPLDKIKICDIVSACGLNRQTFYYHFQDIYSLIEWMYLYDGKEIVRKTYGNNDVFVTGRAMLEYVDDHREELNAIMGSKAEIYFYNFLKNGLSQCFDIIINELTANMTVSEDFKTFLGKFYTSSIVGVIDEWVKAPESNRVTANELLKMFDCAFNGTMKLAIENYKVSDLK